ncbi:5-carboxymethyl-2-hydroxymuconate isomerase [Chromobacterium sp. ATCC 53434]|uniref:5-carboxymethyl-2-hydroxymuconate Delta-isomerase n=1 Tax=Chromobacterium sp. (strain ATCC 53434 / SC 14030) TaxID=2059672 RepID=UPI000C76FD85|nr:5-carboxymethyl-2-hydroxymuconate Delta-isomerase [Chromobacterium sp. ATCC 53434]AUH49582.1 5-carboxymethyl-2-hydroxymuconate isomerase [Chromobacterium sp. ATCC 53434]
MPHCVIECSAQIAAQPDIHRLLQSAHQAADASGLFETHDIKVRLLPYEDYLVGGKDQDFVHIVCHILAGRSDEQKGRLANSLVHTVCAWLPDVAMVSCEVRDIVRAHYSNRRQIMAQG